MGATPVPTGRAPPAPIGADMTVFAHELAQDGTGEGHPLKIGVELVLLLS